MASTSLQSLHQSILRHWNHHQHCFTSSPDSIFFKPSKSYRLVSNVHSSSSSPTSTTSSSTVAPAAVSSSAPLDALANYLSTRDFRQADEETRRLLIALGGEAAQKRGYVFFSEVQFIEAADLQAIDRLWRQHSGGRFGYAVQRRLWEKSGRDFTRFFIRVGWMRRLDTEVEQYGYRSFPGEFMWEFKDDTPEGHLPLTNALRGTQLLRGILTHPAFEEIIEEGGEKSEEEGGIAVEEKGKEQPKLLGGKRVFKPDYSF
ncbi:hypothetical protein B296_00036114 [Ensete ventricosum]|uniref:GUN4-like domain-containing protein n=1 Tax=Ensete ventricosum TaxID=4639 RepID=A0A426Y317_ENSVE|nr:hypothetical protein B296_00036114 [Ensete ventricosum]